METFIWKNHTQSTEYPEGYTARLGNSYLFASEPRSVDQRIFTLSFTTMAYFTTNLGAVNATKTPLEMNFGALEAFYQYHRMWRRFIYPHPIYGNVTGTFLKPLMVPQGIPSGGGWLQPFGLQIIEHP